MTFEKLGIQQAIIDALNANGITKPTPIQEQVIPHLLQSDADLVAVAQTGTGKTAAFCLPILQQIDAKSPNIQALVLVPTRELGQQVAREFFLFSKFLSRVFAEAVYGGAPIEEQIKKLQRSTQVLVATPGRLIDLLDRKALNLSHVKYLVLDEADEMMNMGFKAEVDSILKLCKSATTKMLFTATMPADVMHIITDFLKPNYTEIRINATELVNQKIEHEFVMCSQAPKLAYLKAFLHQRKGQRGIAFCRTKVAAKQLAKQLGGFEVVADALHGNLNQEMRDKVMRGFKKGRIQLLVATDIAARGIDVRDLDYVLHYHLPEKAEYYTHRSGRTARAGKSGVSICFVTDEDSVALKNIENELNISFDELVLKPLTEKRLENRTIYVNIGFGQGFTKALLREFLVEEAGLNANDIENIVVEDNRSYFTIAQNFEQQLYTNLKGYKIAHRNLKFSLDAERSKRNIY